MNLIRSGTSTRNWLFPYFCNLCVHGLASSSPTADTTSNTGSFVQVCYQWNAAAADESAFICWLLYLGCCDAICCWAFCNAVRTARDAAVRKELFTSLFYLRVL